MRSSVRIVLASSFLAAYPQGAGLWTGFLQYMFGLDALGHDVFWLEVLQSTGSETADRELIDTFLRRFKDYGFGDRCAVLLFDRHSAVRDLRHARAFGQSTQKIKEIAASADLVWNFACSLSGELLALFRRRVLVDGDPGMVQISALTHDMGIQHHEVLFTVGGKVAHDDCEIPTIDREWHPFVPCIFFPAWKVAPDPGAAAPFTSITQWNWGEYCHEGRTLSISKRAAYLEYLDLPLRAVRSFELAANIDREDSMGDRALLRSHGWRISDPHLVAATPQSYREYIAASRAEFSCPKPIYRHLKTGWLSERSACYLAMGRPVLAEDTGFSDVLPTGAGLLAFSNMDEAVAGVLEIDRNYVTHSAAAREFAYEHLNSNKCLTRMLSACF